MLNINNFCSFEGRLVKDPSKTVIGTGENAYSKVLMTIAVARNLTSKQKQNGAQEADFINLIAYGKNADFIASYFSKGKPIKVLASYRSFEKTDDFGNKMFGSYLNVEQVSFTLSDSGSKNNDNNNNNNNNNNNFNDNFPPDDYYDNYDAGDMPF